MWPFKKREPVPDAAVAMMNEVRRVTDLAAAEILRLRRQLEVAEQKRRHTAELLPLLLGYVTNLRAEMITPSEAGKELTMIHARLVEITTESTEYIEKLPKPKLGEPAEYSSVSNQLDALPLPAKLQR